MELLNDLLIPGVSLLEKIVRPILVYFFLLVVLRLAGKRELGQITGFDLVVLLMLSNTVQNAIIGDDNSVSGGAIGAATLLVCNYLVVRIAYRYPVVSRWVEGTPTTLVSNGQVILEHLTTEVITQAELRASLRRQGFEDLSEVKVAILETSGSLTVEPQRPSQDELQTQAIVEQLTRIETGLSAISQQLQGGQ